uniref:LRRCT domain-containing protein n=1 Tax=Branchiostoma floridae TaxID=7739 RepID=C3YFL1_BRAFL|eukprot:XP_002604964.1 hypothetical protein BRAFLDRAFT_92604 [Branchiostoma floridae]
MLFIFLLAAACEATYANASPFPECNTAGWEYCMPFKDRPGVTASGTCVLCGALNEDVTSRSPFSFLAGANSAAIKGYPFHVLSAKKLAPLEHSVVGTLALIDANITDVMNGTFASFSFLGYLSLDSNMLTDVKKNWFTGLKNLFVLILSNNEITNIEPGVFVHVPRLSVLNLENNMLRVVDPDWLFGLKGHRITLYLKSNEIKSISPASFQHLQLGWLDLRSNDLSCLDEDVLREQYYSLSRLHVSSGMLSSARGVVHARPHGGMMWRLDRIASVLRGLVTMIVQVPKFLFCVRYNAHEVSFGWKFDSSNDVVSNVDLGTVAPGMSCGDLGSSLSTISIQTPLVVVATDGSLTDKLVLNTLDQCRQVWEYGGGVTVGLGGESIFRLVSIATENTASADVGMSFIQTKDTSTLTTKEPTANINATHDNTMNITCILLNKGEHTNLFFTVSPVIHQTHTKETTYRSATEQSSNMTPYPGTTEKDYTSSEATKYSTLQVSTSPVPDRVVPTTTPRHVLIPVVVSAVVGLVVVVVLSILIWKLCSKDELASVDAHVWTIPPGIAFPGLLRSASLPACSNNISSNELASWRSLPTVLHSIEPTYSEIPDNIASAQRPLPGLPHEYWEIPDDAISASLPVRTPWDAESCRSLPAVLPSSEPNYSQIPDHLAAAQRPLPAFPNHEPGAQRPPPAQPHTYSEIPDDEESGPMPFYDAAAEFSIRVVGQNRRFRQTNDITSSRHRSGRPIVSYGSAVQTKSEHSPFYRMAHEVQGIRARRQMRTALVSPPADQSVKTYINTTDAILSRGQDVTRAHIDFLTLPDTYWPWKIRADGPRHTQFRRSSLPLVTLPNTYWPWEIPGEGTHDTQRRTSLPLVTPLNTYWPGERTCSTPRRASLPLVTPPNTYWPLEIREEGTRNTPRRASLCHTTKHLLALGNFGGGNT